MLEKGLCLSEQTSEEEQQSSRRNRRYITTSWSKSHQCYLIFKGLRDQAGKKKPLGLECSSENAS